jgi:hypothetical protein
MQSAYSGALCTLPTNRKPANQREQDNEMTITARFDSTCTQCSKPVYKGQSVEWTRGARGVYHTDCTAAATDRPSTAEPSRNPRRRGARSHYTRFAGGAEVFTNARGRCEDAPCCGCCS